VADAGGRSGGDDVARRQVSEIRYERDDLRDRIDQHVGARALHLCPVEPCHQSQLGWVRDFVGRRQHRPERAGGPGSSCKAMSAWALAGASLNARMIY